MISYSQARSEKTLIGHIWDSLYTDQNTFSIMTVTRFLVFTTSSSYKSNITKIWRQMSHNSYILIRRVRIIYKQEWD